jgi:hypothetical protein
VLTTCYREDTPTECASSSHAVEYGHILVTQLKLMRVYARGRLSSPNEVAVNENIRHEQSDFRVLLEQVPLLMTPKQEIGVQALPMR